MIRRIQARRFRCLRHVDVHLDRFQVAVGPNGSGKSTFFDVLAFLRDMVREGLETAVTRRTNNFQDLVWGRHAPLRFELAVEVDIPGEAAEKLPRDAGFRAFRYEIAVEEVEGGLLRIADERGLLMPRGPGPRRERPSLFPAPLPTVPTILQGGGKPAARTIFSRSQVSEAGPHDLWIGGKPGARTILSEPPTPTRFHAETTPRSGKGWAVSISLAPGKSALRNLPESPEAFPVATHFRSVLESGVKSLFLDSDAMRKASPPHLGRIGLRPDGSNLPWIVGRLKREDPDSFGEWLRHVRTTLADLRDLAVTVRQDDRHAYLVLEYETGVRVPSWAASDGTLRFLALTLLAYLPSGAVYLIEEPENGLHPLALDAIYDAFWSAHESQVLTATHSPAFLKLVQPVEALCFAKDGEGATDIVHGPDHPHLRDWQGRADMDLLFATGVIG